MTRATLPAQARLHRPSEFAAALKGRRLARGAFFIVSAASAVQDAKPAGQTDALPAGTAEAGQSGRQAGSTQPACARLGLVIAKRFAPHAVTRNALKRVIREAFRARRLALPARDYVVRLQTKIASVSLTELKRAARAEVDAHFERIAR